MIGRTNSGGAGDPSIPVGTGQHLVTFYDFDGKVLKRQRVATGGNATAPTTPTHQYLTFAEWNNPFTNVQSDIDTGAIYNTTDGKTYLFITLTPVTGLAPTLYFSKSSTSLMTIDWGDGTTSTSTTSGNQSIQHTYASAGDYIITVDNSAGGTWRVGQGTTTSMLFYQYENILTKVYLSNNVTLTGYSFYLNCSLESISFSKNTYINALYAFRSAEKLKHLNFNNLETNSFLSGQFLYLAYSVNKLVLTNVIIDLGNNSIQNSFGMKKIIIPQSVKTINQNVFSGNKSMDIYILLPTLPPSLTSTSSFTGINPICKIYVPDASVEAYRTATNWITYANYIYPLSQKPQSDE